MLNENAKLWVAALRSGEYPQTIGRLHVTQRSPESRRPVGLCCLGVACVAAMKAGLELETKSFGTIADDNTREVSYDGEIAVLPNRVRAWLKLVDITGQIPIASLPQDVQQKLSEATGERFTLGFTSLAVLNDYCKLSFDRIADIIESEPPGLFVP